MDRIGADFYKGLESIYERLTPNAQPINIPIGAEDKFEGIIDLITMKAVYFKGDRGETIETKEIPADLLDKAKEYRKLLIEKVVEQDEESLNQYLEGKEPTVEKTREILRKCTINEKIVPVLCGSLLGTKEYSLLLMRL